MTIPSLWAISFVVGVEALKMDSAKLISNKVKTRGAFRLHLPFYHPYVQLPSTPSTPLSINIWSVSYASVDKRKVSTWFLYILWTFLVRQTTYLKGSNLAFNLKLRCKLFFTNLNSISKALYDICRAGFCLGLEPWSSGYGRRLMFQRLRVRILALYTGWTFFHIPICCKICNVCLKGRK